MFLPSLSHSHKLCLYDKLSNKKLLLISSSPVSMSKQRKKIHTKLKRECNAKLTLDKLGFTKPTPSQENKD
jgi:hypothetical protein